MSLAAQRLKTLVQQAEDLDKQIASLAPWVIKMINQRVALARAIEFQIEVKRQSEQGESWIPSTL